MQKGDVHLPAFSMNTIPTCSGAEVQRGAGSKECPGFLMGYKPKRLVNGHWQSVLPILDSLWAKPPQALVALCCVSKSGVCANQERLHFVAV